MDHWVSWWLLRLHHIHRLRRGHGAERGGERVGFSHLTVLTAGEPGVAAGEDDGLRAQSLSDHRGRAVRQLAFRLGPGRDDDPS